VTVASGVEVAGQPADAAAQQPARDRGLTRLVRRLRPVPVVALLALFGVTFALLIGRPVGHADEAWFLWVLTRVARGETLYRGVYFVSTPVPVWLGVAAVRVFGSQILVTRVLATLCFTMSTGLGWLVARRCGVTRLGRVLLVVALFVYASPLANFASFYSALAVLFALGSLVALLRWIDVRDPSTMSGGRELVGAGVVAGFSFASKPNIGLAAVGAIIAIVVAARAGDGWRSWRREVGLVVGPSLGISAVAVLIVAATGAWSAFTADVFTGKTHYLDVFTGGYLPGLRNIEQILPFVGPPSAAYANRLWYTASLLPILAAATAIGAIVKTSGPRRLQAGALASFTAVGAVASIPRGGPQHLAETAPLFVAVIVGSVGLIAPAITVRRTTRALTAGLAVWLSIATVAVVARAVEPLGQSTESLSGLPHVVGAAVADHTVRGVRTFAAQARRAHATRLFVIRPDASYYYLTGGLQDSTPFDFPGVSDLGRDDQAGVIRLLGRGSVRWVCVDRPARRGASVLPTRPVRLEGFVRRTFIFVNRLRICDLYRFRTAAPPRHP
jgi:hypothetical protein